MAPALVGDIAAKLPISRPAVSQHLKDQGERIGALGCDYVRFACARPQAAPREGQALRWNLSIVSSRQFSRCD
jgi:Bacterial regulatory protein, arsR family